MSELKIENFHYLIGLSVDEVRKQSGIRLRVVEKDGKGLFVHDDLKLDRVNVRVSGDKIISLAGIY